MLKKTSIAVAAFALAFAVIAAPAAMADEPFERLRPAASYEEAIERFPESLRNGFRAMRAALLEMDQAEGNVLEVLNSYIALNFIRVNVINAELEQIPFPNQDVNYTEFYERFRARMIANAVHIMPAIIVMGNPFGTDWDQWFNDIEEYL